MCIIFINILSTVSHDIFVGTVKQIVKFIVENTNLKTSKKYYYSVTNIFTSPESATDHPHVSK